MKEPKVTAGGSSEPLEIRIKIVKNGVRVCTFRDGEPTESEYVYKDMAGAIKELESVLAVLKEDEPKVTAESLDKMEKEINEGEY